MSTGMCEHNRSRPRGKGPTVRAQGCASSGRPAGGETRRVRRERTSSRRASGAMVLTRALHGARPLGQLRCSRTLLRAQCLLFAITKSRAAGRQMPRRSRTVATGVPQWFPSVIAPTSTDRAYPAVAIAIAPAKALRGGPNGRDLRRSYRSAPGVAKPSRSYLREHHYPLPARGEREG